MLPATPASCPFVENHISRIMVGKAVWVSIVPCALSSSHGAANRDECALWREVPRPRWLIFPGPGSRRGSIRTVPRRLCSRGWLKQAGIRIAYDAGNNVLC